jgi:hypothetical protein
LLARRLPVAQRLFVDVDDDLVVVGDRGAARAPAPALRARRLATAFRILRRRCIGGSRRRAGRAI